MKRARDDSPYFEGVQLGVSEVPNIPKLKAARFKCKNCSRDITLEIRISCAVCESFLLCLTCFSVGAELAPHKAHHDYHVHRSTHFPLYSANWGADEELLLLEGVSLFGLGNWPDIADHVGTKTADECSSHFFAVYVDTPTFPDPGPLFTAEEVAALPTLPILPRVPEKRVPFKPGLSLPVKAQLGSFMPLRNEFDTTYNEDAEEIPAEIVFNEDDTNEERAIKVAALQVHHQMLQERKLKTAFLVKHNLLDWKQIQQQEKNMSKDEQALVVALRGLLQCCSREQWDRFLQGLLNEQHLRREISRYKALRESGVRWKAEAEKFLTAARESTLAAASSKSQKRFKSGGALSALDGRLLRSSSSGALFRGPQETLAAGLEQITAAESEFCEAFSLHPQTYLMVKEALIREFCRAGKLSKKDARVIAAVPAYQVDQIYEFFEASGWVNNSMLQQAVYPYGIQQQQQPRVVLFGGGGFSGASPVGGLAGLGKQAE